MATDLDLVKLSAEELRALSKDIEKAIRKKQADNLRKAREAADAAARMYGFTLDEVVGVRTSKRSEEASVAKFRNPKDPTQTWSGRGRQPQWFKDAIAGGRTSEDFAA